MNKKIILAVALVIALASCGKNSGAYKDLKAQYDSLALVNQNYESEVSEMDSIISGVLANFQEISQMEGMINVNPLAGDIKKTQKERIQDNMELISQRLRENRENIAKLESQLKKTSGDNTRLGRTLKALKKQFAEKEAEIQRLNDELVRKNLYIGMQDSIIGHQNADLNDKSTTIAEQKGTIAEQDRNLNRVSYCVGTNSDLKEMGILVKGHVQTETANMNYFKSVDRRNLSQLPLSSKKAELLTSHPSSSYELVPGADKMLTLVIKDADKFWSNSRILVVLVR